MDALEGRIDLRQTSIYRISDETSKLNGSILPTPSIQDILEKEKSYPNQCGEGLAGCYQSKINATKLFPNSGVLKMNFLADLQFAIMYFALEGDICYFLFAAEYYTIMP